MKLILVFVVMAIAGILVNWLKKQNPNRKTEKEKWLAKQFLLSKTELSFFSVLQKITKENHYIFAKVRQADLINPLTDNRSAFQSQFNRIAQRHIDFVICDRQTSKPLFLIELNDSSHERADRKERDRQLRNAVKDTDIKLIEITAAAFYSPEKIKQLIYGNATPTKMQNPPDKNQTVSQNQPDRDEPNSKCFSDCKDTRQRPT